MSSVTRDVVRDLWPLYESGEATPDTCALVERFLDDDADLARELRAERGLKSLLAYPLPPDLDREMLAKARRRLWRSDVLHWLTVAALVVLAVIGHVPGGIGGLLDRLVRLLPAPAVTGYRVLPDGRRIDVLRLEQRVPGDALILHYYTDAAGCAIDAELDAARDALAPETAESRAPGVVVNAYDRDGSHLAMAAFERDRRDGRWSRVTGGIPGCPLTEAAIARSPRPEAYREELRRRYPPEEKREGRRWRRRY